MDTHEKVFRVYELINERIANEDRLMAERGNLFLLSSSILLAGFGMLVRKSYVLTVIIPIVGLLICYLMHTVSWGMVRELKLLQAIAQTIELEEDSFKELRKRELVPHTAWNYWWRADSRFIRSRKEENPLYARLLPLSCWEKRFTFGILKPENLYTFYFPAAFFVVWAAALILVLSQQFATV